MPDTAENREVGELESAEDKSPSFPGKLLKSIPVILFACVFGLIVHKSGWLGFIENASLDLVASTGRQLSREQLADKIVIVDIDDRDYEIVFDKKKSPLNPSKLSLLLEAIAKGNPDVIAVDIETEHVDDKNLVIPDFGGKIVWGRHWHQLPDEEAYPLIRTSMMGILDQFGKFVEPHSSTSLGIEAISVLPVDRRVVLVEHPILGGAQQQKSVLSGIAYLPGDIDRTIRRYCRRLQVVETDEKGKRKIVLRDSLPWATVKALNQGFSSLENSESNNVVIAFVPKKEQQSLPIFKARTILDLYERIKKAEASGEGLEKVFSNKIALLGGTFEEARDDYETRVGSVAGVNIIAQIIATELNYKGTRNLSDGWLLILQIVVCIIYVSINILYSGTWLRVFLVFAIPLAAIGFSQVALQNFALWANFVPALVVVQGWELIAHIQSVVRKNIELKEANQSLQQSNELLENTNRALQETNDLLVATEKKLARGLDEGQQMERKRVSASLHDETMMDLFQVEVAISALKDNEDVRTVYDKAYDRLQETRKNVRSTMENLYPSVLKNLGMSAALDTLCKNLSTKSFVVTFDDTTNGIDKTLPESDQFRLYTIAQNALRNTVQHSGATKARVELKFDGDNLVMSISDNGKGFDGTSSKTGSQGVSNMKANAALLDGNIEWLPSPSIFGCGTEVRLTVPTKAEQ